MKKILTILLAAAALFGGLSACQEKDDTGEIKVVDLRYKVANDVEYLPASSAGPIIFYVKSSDPWRVYTAHPDWCMIEDEEGAGVGMELIRQGKGDKDTVTVNYYDNKGLDDRIDTIFIASDYWIGKTIKVIQKGIAYMTIADDQLNLSAPGSASDVSFTVNSNQKWSCKVAEGEEWLSVKSGETGELDGTVVLSVTDNLAEKRYGKVKVFDRHDVLMYTVNVTQNGIQLEPQDLELRALFDQTVYNLPVAANTKWTASKEDPEIDWYTLPADPTFDGSATLSITLTQNTGASIRDAYIILKTVPANTGDYVAEKKLWLRQANDVVAEHRDMNAAEYEKWTSDWTETPVAVSPGPGYVFGTKARINRSGMGAPGYYKFHIKDIVGNPRVRLWYTYGDQEIKYALNFSASPYTEIELRNGGNLPTSPTSVAPDPTTDHTFGIKYEYDAAIAPYCKIIFMLDDQEIYSYNSSDTVSNMSKWGDSVMIYFGAENAGSSIVFDWYEYYAPFSWDD